MKKSSSTSPTILKARHWASSNISGEIYFTRRQAKKVSISWEIGKATASPSSVLLLLIIATLTLLTWTLIKNSLHAQGWNPQRSSHECFEISKPWLFQPSHFQLRWQTGKAWKSEHLPFTTKIDWGALLQLSGVFWIWICTQIDVLNFNLHSNLELTYYIFLRVGVRQMTSPQVSELSLKKELPFIFLPLSRMIKMPPYVQ